MFFTHSTNAKRATRAGFTTIAAIAIFILTIPDPAPRAADLPEQWSHDYAATMALAQAKNKPVMAVFSTSWCPPCQKMVQEVYPQAVVIEELNNWAPVYIDGDKEREILEKHGVKAFPTFVLMASDGTEMDRIEGAIYKPGMFAEKLKRVRSFGSKIKSLNANLETSPNNPALLKERGDFYFDNDKTDLAEKDYRKAANLDPENKTGVAADLKYLEAVKLYEVSPAEAEATAKILIEKYPDSPRVESAYFLIGVTYFKRAQPADCLKAFKTYAEKYPNGENIDQAKALIEKIEASMASQPQ